jgi:hypothetical protein
LPPEFAASADPSEIAAELAHRTDGPQMVFLETQD